MKKSLMALSRLAAGCSAGDRQPAFACSATDRPPVARMVDFAAQTRSR